MPAEPQTDRFYAYFRATGYDDPALVTKALGIEPDKSWAVGDDWKTQGPTRQRFFSSWKLNSGLLEDKPLDDHIEALLLRLRQRRSGLLEVSTTFSLQIVCVAHVSHNFSWEIRPETLREVAALGLGIWFDLYGFGDVHEEIVGLREQLGLRNVPRDDGSRG